MAKRPKMENRIAKAERVLKGQEPPPMATRDRRVVDYASQQAIQKPPVKPGSSH